MLTYFYLVIIISGVYILIHERHFLLRFRIYKMSLLILILTTPIIYYMIYNNDIIQLLLKESNLIQLDLYLILGSSIAITFFIVQGIMYIVQKYTENKEIKRIEEKLPNSKIEYEYYRDIIKKYSPAMLAYCYSKNINIKDSIAATLLNLIKQNKLVIINNNIQLNEKEDFSKLKFHEKLIIRCYINREYTEERLMKKYFLSDLKEDLKRNKLLRSIMDKKINSTYIVEIFLAWQLLILLFCFPIFIEKCALVGLFIICFFLTVIDSFIYKPIQSKINNHALSNEGVEIAAKMKGLKNYINDFSNIKNEGINNFKLFDDYVTYAIILNLPGRLNNEAQKLYNLIK